MIQFHRLKSKCSTCNHRLNTNLIHYPECAWLLHCKLYCTDIVWPLLSLLSSSSSTAIDVKAEISAKRLCYQFLITPAPLVHGVMFNRYSKTNWHSKAVQHCVRVRERASTAAIVHWLCDSGRTEGPPRPPREDMHALWVSCAAEPLLTYSTVHLHRDYAVPVTHPESLWQQSYSHTSHVTLAWTAWCCK